VKVYLLAKPQFGDDEYRRFLEDFLPRSERQWRETDGSTPAERIVEFAGRVCYLSFGPHQAPGTNADYVRKLIINEHESVLEHVNWTVLISGVSRAFSHQLVRHRVGFAFSQLSQQYHDESSGRFIRPEGLDDIADVSQTWETAIRTAQ
jgi:thymidylate synthase (FAD)